MWQAFKHSLFHFCFPSTCLHCHVLLSPGGPCLCSLCASQLELLDFSTRCLRCFQQRGPSVHGCRFCRKEPSLFLRQAAVFEDMGPALSLVSHLKNGRPYLAVGLGAYLFAQFERLEWPLPDGIVPVPLSFFPRLERGYSQSILLAEELGKLLNVPVWNILKKEMGGFSQEGLLIEQRKQLDSVFALRKKATIQDRALLVIDDWCVSGATLNRCAEALCAGYPGALYALTILKSSI